MQISVVVPVRNEAANVAPLIDEIRSSLDGRFEYEIIYVDDGSDDATLSELRAAQAVMAGRLRILRHDRSRGQSTAVWNGVSAARGPVIVTLDGDGQNDPADIPRLVEALATQQSLPLQLAIGHRINRRDGFVRRASSRVANGVRAWLLKDETPDTGCGIKAFKRDAFLSLPYFDHMHRFLPALIQRQGGKVVSVPVNHRPRERGTSKYGIHNRLWVGIVDLFGVAWLMRRERRDGVTELEARPRLVEKPAKVDAETQAVRQRG